MHNTYYFKQYILSMVTTMQIYDMKEMIDDCSSEDVSDHTGLDSLDSHRCSSSITFTDGK